MQRGVVDKLLDLCEHHAEEIARRWYKDVSSNARTPSYHSLPKEGCILQAVSFFENQRQMYFAEDHYQEVQQFLGRKRYVEETYGAGIPLHEAVYALILMRRHIWLYAEFQAVFTTVIDMYQAVNSINRAVLLFDYAIFIVTQKYQELAQQKA
jgi:hypothetical protein